MFIHRGTSEHILERHVADDTDDAANNGTEICPLENRWKASVGMWRGCALAQVYMEYRRGGGDDKLEKAREV